MKPFTEFPFEMHNVEHITGGGGEFPLHLKRNVLYWGLGLQIWGLYGDNGKWKLLYYYRNYIGFRVTTSCLGRREKDLSGTGNGNGGHPG